MNHSAPRARSHNNQWYSLRPTLRAHRIFGLEPSLVTWASISLPHKNCGAPSNSTPLQQVTKSRRAVRPRLCAIGHHGHREHQGRWIPGRRPVLSLETSTKEKNNKPRRVPHYLHTWFHTLRARATFRRQQSVRYRTRLLTANRQAARIRYQLSSLNSGNLTLWFTALPFRRNNDDQLLRDLAIA